MNSLDEYFSNHINITNDTKDRIKTTVLFDSYSKWKKSLMKFNNEKYVNQTSFNSYVNELGIKKRDSNGKRFFDGISFKSEEIIPDLKETVIPSVPVKLIVNSSPSKEITNLDKPKNSHLIKMSPIPQTVLVKKLRLRDNFIKFKNFSLHIPSYSAVTGKMPNDVTYLFENPLDLASAIHMLRTKTVSGLDDKSIAKIYSDNINSVLDFPPNKACFLIFASGLKHSRLTFHRDLLLVDTYDELYDVCSKDPLLVKEIKT